MENKKGCLSGFGGLLLVAVVVIAKIFLVREKVEQAVREKVEQAVREKEGLPPLEQSIRLLNDPSPKVRNSAALLIHREAAMPIGGLRSIPPDSLPGLVAAAQDRDSAVSKAACLCLRKIGGPAVPALLAAVEKQTAVSWPCAVFGLSPLAKPAVVLAKDPTRPERRRVCRALGLALGAVGEPALPELIKTLRRPGASGRLAAATGLGVLGPKASEAVAALADLLSGHDTDLQVAVAASLSRIGKVAVPALAAKLESDDVTVRIIVASVLARIGPRLSPKEKREKLQGSGAEGIIYVSELEKRQWSERKEAKKSAVSALVKALQDSSPNVRVAAAAALADFEDQRKVVAPVLEELRKSPDGNISRKAARVLSDLEELPPG
jgi:HEAT repeat protein